MAKKEKYRKPEAGELFRYAEGGMTGRERNAFERRLQKDLFEADAAEGFSKVSREEAEHDLGIAGTRIRRRINRRKRIAWYSAAAAFAALMIVGTVFFSLNDTVQPDKGLPGLRESATGQPEQPVDNLGAETDKEVEPAGTDEKGMAGTDEMGMAGTDELAGTEAEEVASQDNEKKSEHVNQQVFQKAATDAALTAGREKALDAEPASPEEVLTDRAAIPDDAADATASEVQPAATVTDRETVQEGQPSDKESAGKAVPETQPAKEGAAGETDKKVQPAKEGAAGEAVKAEKKVLYPVKQPDNRVRVEARSSRAVSAPGEKGDRAGVDRIAAKTVTFSMVAAKDTEQTDAVPGDTTGVTRSALPSDGITAFRNYLDSALVTPAETAVTGTAEVMLSLIVAPDGRPGQFEVINSPSELHSKEAIRVIKEGPAWLPALQQGEYTPEPVMMTVRFRE